MKCKSPCEVEIVKVKIPADLSSTRKVKWKKCHIDKCISSIVRAFQKSKINMRGSCCGHGNVGDIHLQDGRVLLILDKKTSKLYLKRKSKKTDLKKILTNFS
jgi:hypothetical protein